MQIELKNVKKAYGKQLVLDVEHLELPGNAIIAVVGENGAGKSTLLKIIGDLMKKDGGEITYDGDTNIPLREMTMVFQQPYLIRTTVRKNIAWPLKIRKVSEEKREEIVRSLSQQLKLDAYLDKKATKLSLGESQKVALARALAFRPKCLLLDEPCASTDPAATAEIEKMLVKTKESSDTTILLVTHNLAQAKRIADHVVLLQNGKVAESCDADTFFYHPRNPQTQKFIEGDLLI